MNRGYNMGTRLIEDFLARTGLQRCSTFAETAEVISKVCPSSFPTPSHYLHLLEHSMVIDRKGANKQVAFKTFLNITPNLSFPPPPPTTPNAAPQEFILTFEENPLAEFAELPPDAREGGLWFSNVLCGVVRGALEMVSTFLDSLQKLPSSGISRRRMADDQIQLQVETRFLSDVLRGDETTEMHVRLIRVLEEEQPENDE